jgi:hypothetical protein
MASFITVISGIPTLQTESAAATIYNETLTVVSGTPGTNEVQGPVTTGTAVTLPQSGTYTQDELEIRLNGVRLEEVVDYQIIGASPPRTQVQFTFDLVVGDQLVFRVDRAP